MTYIVQTLDVTQSGLRRAPAKSIVAHTVDAVLVKYRGAGWETARYDATFRVLVDLTEGDVVPTGWTLL